MSTVLLSPASTLLQKYNLSKLCGVCGVCGVCVRRGLLAYRLLPCVPNFHTNQIHERLLFPTRRMSSFILLPDAWPLGSYRGRARERERRDRGERAREEGERWRRSDRERERAGKGWRREKEQQADLPTDPTHHSLNNRLGVCNRVDQLYSNGVSGATKCVIMTYRYAPHSARH